MILQTATPTRASASPTGLRSTPAGSPAPTATRADASGGADTATPTGGDAPTGPQTLDGWVGHWAGEVEVTGGPYHGTRLPMHLDIQPLGPERYTWTIRYGDEPARPYELRGLQAGHYLLDEKNGILIDNYLLGDTLYSHFEVAQSRVSARYRKQGNVIEVEMDSFGRDRVRESGTPQFQVSAYPLRSVQIGTLRPE